MNILLLWEILLQKLLRRVLLGFYQDKKISTFCCIVQRLPTPSLTHPCPSLVEICYPSGFSVQVSGNIKPVEKCENAFVTV